METIYIYNENCVMAGRQVPMQKLEEYRDPSEGNDWTGYEATEDTAKFCEGRGAFGNKVAATIRVFNRHPLPRFPLLVSPPAQSPPPNALGR